MMNVEQNFNYGSTDDLQILQMSYKGEDLSMLVLLPKESDGQRIRRALSLPEGHCFLVNRLGDVNGSPQVDKELKPVDLRQSDKGARIAQDSGHYASSSASVSSLKRGSWPCA